MFQYRSRGLKISLSRLKHSRRGSFHRFSVALKSACSSGAFARLLLKHTANIRCMHVHSKSKYRLCRHHWWYSTVLSC